MSLPSTFYVIARRSTGRRGNLLLKLQNNYETILGLHDDKVYMMTNRNKTVIYTGVTNNLRRRIQEHKDKKGSSFTKRYNITKLVYYESFSRIYDAITAEKKIKSGSRAKKIALIESINPYWKELYDSKIASLHSQ